jgi:dinuclear metal center YbgI/SA1388 family protein
MRTVGEICCFLESVAPSLLAEDWDNVGLLVGDSDWGVQKLMTCLTATPASVSEAVAESADMIVAHHPLPFRPLSRLTGETVTGRLLLELIGHKIALYSPHTAFDSAGQGINQQLADGLSLVDVQSLVPCNDQAVGLGAGRYGRAAEPVPVTQLAERVKSFLNLSHVFAVGEPDHIVQSVAVACGSAGQFLEPARQAGCDVLITGETSFHTCLEAEATGVTLLLTGHFASERFAVEGLAETLSERFTDVPTWASLRETDPLRLV